MLHNLAGMASHALGNYDVALAEFRSAIKIQPDIAELHNNLGNSLRATGDLLSAEASFKNAINIDKSSSIFQFNIGAVYDQKNELEHALHHLKKSVEINPKFSKAQSLLGLVFKKLGDLTKASKHLEEALKLDPENIDALNNLGLTFLEDGKLELAKKNFLTAISKHSNFCEPHVNLAGIYIKEKNMNAATECLKLAIKLNPNFAPSYNIMGILFHDARQFETAIKYFLKALELDPNYSTAYVNFGTTLSNCIFNTPQPDLLSIVKTMLTSNRVRPSSIARSVISLIRSDPHWIEHKHLVMSFRKSPRNSVIELNRLPLLTDLMRACPIADLEIEKVLIFVRSEMLKCATSHTVDEAFVTFQSSLAIQCFINEYIYPETEFEVKALEGLKEEIENNLSLGDQPNPFHLLCFASYKPLNTLKNFSHISESSVPSEIYKLHIRDFLTEKRLQSSIMSITEISDNVSKSVQGQYEKNPYPRWINLSLTPAPSTIRSVFSDQQLKITDERIFDQKNIKVLIAGCGTGQHAIETARRYKNASVTAIDLSKASLAYAIRKTAELNIENIDYFQADILNLKTYKNQFHIIESSGVLHHMHDPIQGWNNIKNLLLPGGLMRIGLYSELARRSIVRTREKLSDLPRAIKTHDMKKIRQALIGSSEQDHINITNFGDFYSLSNLRDLLFHVQEHRFTLPQLKVCLDELGLAFCGFESQKVLNEFKEIYQSKDSEYDLGLWAEFEHQRPDTFANMYQFWCQVK